MAMTMLAATVGLPFHKIRVCQVFVFVFFFNIRSSPPPPPARARCRNRRHTQTHCPARLPRTTRLMDHWPIKITLLSSWWPEALPIFWPIKITLLSPWWPSKLMHRLRVKGEKKMEKKQEEKNQHTPSDEPIIDTPSDELDDPPSDEH